MSMRLTRSRSKLAPSGSLTGSWTIGPVDSETKATLGQAPLPPVVLPGGIAVGVTGLDPTQVRYSPPLTLDEAERLKFKLPAVSKMTTSLAADGHGHPATAALVSAAALNPILYQQLLTQGPTRCCSCIDLLASHRNVETQQGSILTTVDGQWLAPGMVVVAPADRDGQLRQPDAVHWEKRDTLRTRVTATHSRYALPKADHLEPVDSVAELGLFLVLGVCWCQHNTLGQTVVYAAAMGHGPSGTLLQLERDARMFQDELHRRYLKTVARRRLHCLNGPGMNLDTLTLHHGVHPADFMEKFKYDQGHPNRQRLEQLHADYNSHMAHKQYEWMQLAQRQVDAKVTRESFLIMAHERDIVTWTVNTSSKPGRLSSVASLEAGLSGGGSLPWLGIIRNHLSAALDDPIDHLDTNPTYFVTGWHAMEALSMMAWPAEGRDAAFAWQRARFLRGVVLWLSEANLLFPAAAMVENHVSLENMMDVCTALVEEGGRSGPMTPRHLSGLAAARFFGKALLTTTDGVPTRLQLHVSRVARRARVNTGTGRKRGRPRKNKQGGASGPLVRQRLHSKQRIDPLSGRRRTEVPLDSSPPEHRPSCPWCLRHHQPTDNALPVTVEYYATIDGIDFHVCERCYKGASAFIRWNKTRAEVVHRLRVYQTAFPVKRLKAFLDATRALYTDLRACFLPLNSRALLMTAYATAETQTGEE